MNITFDPNKDRVNQSKHGVSLAEAERIEWDEAVDWEDDRHDYNEERRCALGPIGDRIYYVVYVDRAEGRRIISLRKANKREVLNYVEQAR
ncbi:BrnT family toxin [Massilia dura]|uniref:BrnT family toxin n=1 Tax=Pseudoduganella dura TaxID=321982 RepID=A0A6I3XDQ2_9BURK|nr:BrnT family toxin [Pseudoduganella dura]MUI10918.1 BrnT family toxin [Pseudoduganella dura]GGY12809.1 hypothetical protein GCM10007386_48950 [Pseudoduganella dura]